jgi:hypothetical protein
MSLESIVRPFQTPDSSPARPFFVAGKAGVPNVIMQFGRGGGGRVLNGSLSYSASFYMTQYVNEKSHADFGTAF